MFCNDCNAVDLRFLWAAAYDRFISSGSRIAVYTPHTRAPFFPSIREIALLEMIKCQFDGLMPPQAAGKQDGKQRAVSLPFEALAVWCLTQRLPLLCRQPIPQADSKFLDALYPSNARTASMKVVTAPIERFFTGRLGDVPLGSLLRRHPL